MPSDDLGFPVDLPGRPIARVVSLVPSLSESVAATRPEALVGATQWCTHPADLDVVRVRGTKNPDVSAIVALRPELVLCNQEENRERDVRRLREAGVAVWVTRIETVDEALVSLRRLFADALGWGVPAWLEEVTARWSGPAPTPTVRVAVPIWRDPWMVVGRDTFTGDLLARLGYVNAFAGHADRYPKVEIAEIDRAADHVEGDLGGVDEVLLPDEPYLFTADDGPSSFTRVPTRLVSGRLLTWYGPSLLEVDRPLAR